MENENKVTIHHLFWYFLIFSILGLIIETAYCFWGTGVLESRKGFIWGPFCPVYGVCGATLVFALDKMKIKGWIKLFIAGFVFGSVAEYILSYGLEAIYGNKIVNKIKPHTRNIIELGIFIFLVIDGLVTMWGISTYQNRVVYNKVYKPEKGNIFSNLRSNIENNYFTNERMSTSFPNLRIKNENGEEVWIKTLIKDE